jgi:hypothetical protein
MLTIGQVAARAGVNPSHVQRSRARPAEALT